MCRAV
jgi:hypothetical protein